MRSEVSEVPEAAPVTGKAKILSRRELQPLFLYGILFVGLTFLPENDLTSLAFDRSAIGRGEVYRLLTGHLVHRGLEHLLVNLFGFFISWWLLRKYLSGWQWVVWPSLIALFISLVAYGFSDVNRSIGFSGVLHGLFLIAIYQMREPLWIRLWLAIVIVGKIVLEQMGISLTHSAANFQNDTIVFYDAHLYGFIGGLLMVFYLLIVPLFGKKRG